MNNEERNFWVAFSTFPGIGPARFKLLIDYFGSAKEAWTANEKKLREIGLGELLTARFVSFRNRFPLQDYISEIRKKDIQIITLSDKEYPALLKEIPASPIVLYVRGRLEGEVAEQPRIAVVGTRQITNYGREVTEEITRGLTQAGLTIVSGMAYGVDAVAHETAISEGGKTIAVLGCGIDVVHPVSNATLYWTIIKKNKGIIISEYPPGMRVNKGLFPARNRIISGLSLGVVVTEGAADSGALITARYAAEQGREVFAVPGPITSSLSRGPTALLKQGAKLVTEAEDILEELNIKNQKSKIKITNQISNLKLSKEEEMITGLLVNENLHFDEIMRRSKLTANQVAGILTILEMKKIVKNIGGGMYGVTP